VLFLGVLYHLKDPVRGLESVGKLTSPGGIAIVDTVVDVFTILERPLMAYYPNREMNDDPTKLVGSEPCVRVADARDSWFREGREQCPVV